MKEGIHPKYELVKVKCSCGNEFEVRSTACHDFQIDVCSKCHPFYTGKQKIVDTGGRVERFNKRFGVFAKKTGAKKADKQYRKVLCQQTPPARTAFFYARSAPEPCIRAAGPPSLIVRKAYSRAG